MITAFNLNQVLTPNPPNPDPTVMKGAISEYSNNGNTNEPAWIISRVHKFTDVNAASPTFNATFYMIRIDGTAEHTHSIYDLKLAADPVIDTNSNSTIYNGTTTVILKDGPVSDVPTQISLLDDSAMVITVDSNSTNNHFGTTPIYGTQQFICVDASNLCK